MKNPFIFAVPLKPKASSVDWNNVVRKLNDTLQSIFRSDEKNFLVVLACQDRPETPYFNDPRFIYLPVNFPPQKDRKFGDRDKYAKIRLIGSWILQQNVEESYVMFLDADDLVHKSLVRYVLQDDNKSGYGIRDGYRFDTVNCELALQTGNFHGSCGSCFVGHFKKDDYPTDENDLNSHFGQFVRHSIREELAQQKGKSPVAVPFPAVVYMMNHIESTQMARKDGEIRTLRHRDVMAKDDAAKILKDQFGYEIPEREMESV